LIKKNTDIEKDLKKVFKKIFNEETENYRNFSEKEENKWDSLKGVNLLLEVEKTFSVKISIDDLQNFNSFKNIKKILNKQINEK
tara:strand:- start:651 stop:902 length:252 start_codon:yes stop_codon:yes gene_type:complete